MSPVRHATFSQISAVYFKLYLALAWTIMPLWAVSTWRSRRSLYVRVRQPLCLIADIALTLAVINLISIKELLLLSGRDMPCQLTNAAAALNMVVLPGVMLWRSLHMWYASTIMDERLDRAALSKHFRTWLCLGLLLVALLSVTLATSRLRFCISDM
jgi:hypothetical protein